MIAALKISTFEAWDSEPTITTMQVEIPLCSECHSMAASPWLGVCVQCEQAQGMPWDQIEYEQRTLRGRTPEQWSRLLDLAIERDDRVAIANLEGPVFGYADRFIREC